MADWELKDPWFLLLLLLVPLVYRLAGRATSLLQFSSLQLLQGTSRSLRQRLASLPAVLLSAAVVLLVIATARPRSPQSETRVSRNGIAIMMIVDQSSSMNARDLVEDDQSVNRLDVVKEVFLDFVYGNEGAAGQGRIDGNCQAESVEHGAGTLSRTARSRRSSWRTRESSTGCSFSCCTLAHMPRLRQPMPSSPDSVSSCMTSPLMNDL